MDFKDRLKATFGIKGKAEKEKEKKAAEKTRIQKEITDLKTEAAAMSGQEHRQRYQEIMARKAQLNDEMTKSGITDLNSQMGELESTLETAKGKIEGAEKTGKAARHKDKVGAEKAFIASQRNTPLETLLIKIPTLGGAAKVDPKREGKGSPQGTADKASKRDIFKKKLQGTGKKIRETVKPWLSFANWKENLEKLWEKMISTSDLFGDTSGLAADGIDIQDLGGVMETMTDSDTSGGGLASAVGGGLSALLKSVKFIVAMVREGKKDFGKNKGKVLRDHQERWKLARSYMHDLMDIAGGFQGMIAPISKVIPFYNSIVGIIMDVMNIGLDIMDIASSSVHVHKMRVRRNEIYKKIEEKRQKYSQDGRAPDAEAAKAYEIGTDGWSRSRRVDKKRRELMETIQKNDPTIQLVGKEKLRSRNDSVYRNAQYEIGKRIKAIQKNPDGTYTAENKSKKRQLEAMQMMEEFREVDKSHKKMAKTLTHNIESVVTNGVSFVANGLKLAGEISLNPIVYGSGMGTSMGLGVYGMTRDVTSFGYERIRQLAGTKDNKTSTREDMAISLINKMEDITSSPEVWGTSGSFSNGVTAKKPGLKTEAEITTAIAGNRDKEKEVITQGRNLRHLRSILKDGLDVTMSDLIYSEDKKDLKEKIMENFGQD